MENIIRAKKIIGIGERNKGDFYPTPSFALLPLLEIERFDGSILEPCCGEGHISNVLIENGYNVTSRDLYNRGYGETGVDFLFMPAHKSFDNVITNPPYTLALEFCEAALLVANKKVAMLMKINFLEGVKRKKFFEKAPLKTVYVFSKRITLTKPEYEGKNKGFITYAWFVFEHGYKGKPQIDFI